MIYAQLARFLAPLVLTLVIQGLSGPFLNGGMARMPQAVQILAAFGLAWGLTDFLVSPLSPVRQLSLVLATGGAARRRIEVFVVAWVAALCLALVLLAASPLGDWIIGELHGVGPELGQRAQQALRWLVPLPLLEGMNRLYSGLLLQARRTEWVSLATLAGIGAQIGAVFALLPAPFVRAEPILLPVLAVYCGELAGVAVVGWAYAHQARPALEEGREEPGYGEIFRFFWPLALVMAVQGLSRPMINLLVSRRPDGAEALAVLAVVYPLAHMPYGWLNELRSLPAAFRQVENSLYYIRRFALFCGLLSFACMAGMFWTGMRGFILEELIAVESELARLCRAPLLLFSFFPLVVMGRAYLNGVALVERRTRALAPSAPARIGIIASVLLAGASSQVHGATLGVAALLSGFVLEAGVVWLGVRGWPRWKGA